MGNSIKIRGRDFLIDVSSSGVSNINVSVGSVQCFSSGGSINISNSVNISNPVQYSSSWEKSAKSSSSKSSSRTKALKALPSSSATVISTSNRNIQPEDGYCYLLFFKAKYWDTVRSSFGPNTSSYIATPDNTLRAYMYNNPHMVSSRRDLMRYWTRNNLYHITSGGNATPWELIG